TFSLSVWKPELYFLALLREKLLERGIKVKGNIKLDTLKGSSMLAEIVHPIDSVIHRINKISDNLAAENLLKIIAAETQSPPGTSLIGLRIVKEYLYGISIDTSKLILADGSGMSFYNVVSPDMLTQILQKQYEQKENFQRFLESLPISGVDGTLKNRMKQTRAEGNVKAKTGTITGVSALSGYVKTADDKLLAFSIMCNHHPAQISVLRDMQDKIMEILSNFKFASR
ncbi:MAG TPA: D-alanyl-D-alanine carboxypeptidase/D-alanyl-D-alanine-endopeptidase, partial [Bacteroidota bacterium]|nr:D-alanyl-D-alanine carboxypeptidase/D-alanyl-D-alanine-endopeptidase [Bacteroidota bacterium]